MSSSAKHAGYDQEEKYFHDLNQKLIEGIKQNGTSKALQLRPPGNVIQFPTKMKIKTEAKKAG